MSLVREWLKNARPQVVIEADSFRPAAFNEGTKKDGEEKDDGRLGSQRRHDRNGGGAANAEAAGEEAGNGNWQPDGEETFPDTAAAEEVLASRGTPGRYRILTIQRELAVREETVKKVVLE